MRWRILGLLVALLPAPALGQSPAWRKPLLGSPWGINGHQLIWNAPNPESQALADLGLGWVRVDFPWSQIEPAQGSYDWTVTDGIVAAADAQGLNVYATLSATPQWATDGAADSGVPRDPADWDAFVFAVVDRYKDSIKFWGMWNEPNVSQFWAGTETDYINIILSYGHDAAKRADPGCFVLGPELAHLKSAHWNDWLSHVLTLAGSKVDIITQHAYGGSGQEVLDQLDGPQWPWDPPNVRDVITSAGAGNKPFWLTETGWTTDPTTESTQAQNYQDLLTGMLSRPWFNRVFFYELQDDPNITDAWGVLHADHSPKPSFGTYQAFVAGHQPVPVAPAALSGVEGVPLTFDGSASHDPDNGIASLTWDFDESDGVGVDDTGTVVSHTYAVAGTYTALLTATDPTGYFVFQRIAVTIAPAPVTTGSTGSAGSTGSTGSTSTGSTGGDLGSTSGSTSAGSTSAASTASAASTSSGAGTSSAASTTTGGSGATTSTSGAASTSTSTTAASTSTGSSSTASTTGGASPAASTTGRSGVSARGGCAASGAGLALTALAALLPLRRLRRAGARASGGR